MLILIDFDGTLTINSTLHANTPTFFGQATTFNYSYNQPGEILSNLNHPEKAKIALLECKKRGDTLCIVSNNPNKELIEQYLVILMGEHWNKTISEIQCGNGHEQLKNNVAKELATKYESNKVVLVDDSEKQCQAMSEVNMNSIYANEEGTHWQRLINCEFYQPIKQRSLSFNETSASAFMEKRNERQAAANCFRK